MTSSDKSPPATALKARQRAQQGPAIGGAENKPATGPVPRIGGAFTRGRPFAAGNAGKPQGARNRATLAVEALLEGELKALTRKAIELAKAGDTTALRLCLDRIAPAPKERVVAFELPLMTEAAHVPAALAAILQGVADGALAPGEAAALASLVDRWRNAFELSEIEGRLRALEERAIK